MYLEISSKSFKVIFDISKVTVRWIHNDNVIN